jgi:hypothetical protein
MEGREDIENH